MTMYFNVASRLAISGDGALQFSQAVSMAGANAVLIDATAFNIAAGTLTIRAQEGNDLENWGTLSGELTFSSTSIGYGTLKITDVSGQYLRLRYSQTGAGPSILSAGINTAQL